MGADQYGDAINHFAEASDARLDQRRSSMAKKGFGLSHPPAGAAGQDDTG
jgi:hypothetical protein